ncbi:MAG: tripartite tricarboxylate transporter substrate-binding protein [Proteobacteria bacterium]|nr:tripartite tricarboxylate transporter substrate-binding protein [Pseudomonadota bacterium]
MTICHRVRIAVVSLVLTSIGAFPALGEDGFFKGKTLTLLVGYSAGSTYDTYARLLERHYAKHIPGNPSVIVKNMPGSSSIKASNYVYTVAPKDGLTIGAIRNGMAVEQLYGRKGIRFDALKFNWIGSITRSYPACTIWHSAPATTLNDIKNVEVVSGAIGSSASLAMYPRALNEMLGTKFKVVTGYSATGVLHAMELGEVHARCGGGYDGLLSARPHWFRDKHLKILAMMSNTRHPNLPNAPWIFDFVKDPTDVKTLQFIFSTQEWGRPYVAPPGVPADRVATLRRAFDAAVADPELLADAKKLKATMRDPMSGVAMQKVIAEYHKTPQAIIDRVKTFQKRPKDEKRIKRKKKKK